jgi:Na+/glutamate symporter
VKTIRKALVSGAGAGAAAAIVFVRGEIENGREVGVDMIGGALVAFIVAGVPVGWATWRVENAKKRIEVR